MPENCGGCVMAGTERPIAGRYPVPVASTVLAAAQMWR
jgi:hypothetical protein